MQSSIVIVIPVLARPERVVPLTANVAATTQTPYRLLFIASPSDRTELNELTRVGADFLVLNQRPGPGDYAKKINLAYRESPDPYILTGADDLVFHRGWDIAALSAVKDGIGVVGTNDLGNPRVLAGEHSTHSLVARWYADQHGTMDGPGSIYAECYNHLFVDDELVETAKHRRMWSFAEASHVEHLHPHLNDENGQPKASLDATYKRAFSRVTQDGQLFRQRMVKLKGNSVPISVIVATFGNSSWTDTAQRALDSVHAQSTKADDIIYVHGKDLATARNDGARQARYDHLLFLDADDELHPRFLAYMQRAIRQPAALYNPAVQFVLPEGPRLPKLFKPRDLSLGNYLVIGSVVRAELFWQAGGFDSRWSAWEDWQVWRKVLALDSHIIRVQHAIYIAHWNGQGRNNTIDDPQALRVEMMTEFDEWNAERLKVKMEI